MGLKYNLKLKLAKEAINHFLPQVDRIVGINGKPFKNTSSKIINDMFKRLIKHAESETKAKNVLKDQNFLKLAKTLRNVLLYVAEHDEYYGVWLMTALLLITDETTKFLKRPKATKQRSWCFTWVMREMSMELFQSLNDSNVKLTGVE